MLQFVVFNIVTDEGKITVVNMIQLFYYNFPGFSCQKYEVVVMYKVSRTPLPCLTLFHITNRIT